MGVVTAKQLKQNTGEVIKRVMVGEKLTLTYRGRTIATIEPIVGSGEQASDEILRPYEEAWASIDGTLEATGQVFADWKEATTWFRNRNRS